MAVWPNGSRSIPTVTSEYGPRDPISTPGGTSGSFHAGIDLVGFPRNKAPWAGVVIFARYNGGAGNEVRIQGANGDTARIKHNASFLVSEGQRVAEGQDVGVQGTTGTSTGVHCHFECWINNNSTHTNPRDYMARAIANSAPAGSGGTPLQDKDDEMTYALINRVPGPGLPGVPKDAVFIGHGTDPLVWVSNWGPEMINGVAIAEWNHQAIAERITQVGLRGSGDDIDNVYKSMADAQAKRPAYTLGGGGGKVEVGDITVPADPALVEAVKAQTVVLGQLLAATKALNPPG